MRPLLVLLAAAVLAPAVSGAPRFPDDRMAAYHATLVAINEARPNAGVLTYAMDAPTYMDHYGLVRLAVGVEVGGRTHWASEAKEVEVRDIPGGVEAAWRVAGVKVSTRILALPVGRLEQKWQGAALFGVSVSPRTPVMLRLSGPARVGPSAPRAAWLAGEAAGAWRAGKSAGTFVMQGDSVPVSTAVRAWDGADAPSAGPAELRMRAGLGSVLVAFAAGDAEASALAAADPAPLLSRHSATYRTLLASKIATPDPTLDAAFRSAILTLDYNWLRPLGWVECIHHWHALWHMQHSPGATWIGQADRARECLLSHAEHLMPSGAAPQFFPGGQTHRDFGGSNQFFLWQVRNYLRQTGDTAGVRRLAPALDAVIAQTWHENDPDGDGLLGWGQQIGNQEDYVSTPWNGATPTMEGIQMLLARAEVAVALGDAAGARRLRVRADELAAALRARLWMPDLGRYAFLEEPQGTRRPDGQYHTMLYPAIYGLADAEDAWTGVRQVRDRLTDADGAVYCSANFPWHAVGTWGMQAGVAQQPWAAMGLAAVGLRNETWRPLHAAAAWAQDANHRGAWPEISTEPTAAYFSPPAGLYLQAVVEALFGLRADLPRGEVTVAPSFPDAWPSASLTLPEYRATYRRLSGPPTRGALWRVRYTLETARPLRRRLSWHVPVGSVASLTCDGKPLPYRLRPGVDCALLTASAPASRRTVFDLALRVDGVRLLHDGSVAEGDPLTIRAEVAAVTGVDDRCGILRDVSVAGGVLRGRVRMGLLAPYAGFGRLGRLTFSRRTLFVRVRTASGATATLAATVALLPRMGASGAFACKPGGGFTLRNNTASSVRGTALLRSAAGEFALPVALPPRSTVRVPFALPADRAALLSPGDNQAAILWPDGSQTAFTAPGPAEAALATWRSGRMVAAPLPADLLQPDTDRPLWRIWYAYGHWPWANSRPPATELALHKRLELPNGWAFEPAGRKLAPVSRRVGRPHISVPLPPGPCRRVALLVAPMLDNHDTFTTAARVTVRGSDGPLAVRTLRFPGDLDWWCPAEVVGDFATARGPRKEPHGPLPALPPGASDWPEGRPPAFPQPAFWASAHVYATPSCVFNVVEVDLPHIAEAVSVEVETLTEDACLAVAAVTAEMASGHAALAATPFLPPPNLREPRTLFSLRRAGSLEGWSVTGGFSVASVPSLFAGPTLNSLASGGEAAVGSATSPPFTLDAPCLRVRIHGGHSAAPDGPGTLAVRLVDAADGRELAVLRPNGTHVQTEATFDARAWQGRKVRLVLEDRNNRPSYAWIGVSDITLGPRS